MSGPGAGDTIRASARGAWPRCATGAARAGASRRPASRRRARVVVALRQCFFRERDFLLEHLHNLPEPRRAAPRGDDVRVIVVDGVFQQKLFYFERAALGRHRLVIGLGDRQTQRAVHVTREVRVGVAAAARQARRRAVRAELARRRLARDGARLGISGVLGKCSCKGDPHAVEYCERCCCTGRRDVCAANRGRAAIEWWRRRAARLALIGREEAFRHTKQVQRADSPGVRSGRVADAPARNTSRSVDGTPKGRCGKAQGPPEPRRADHDRPRTPKTKKILW